MSLALQKYLDHVMAYANRSDSGAPQIRAELEDHLLKKIGDLEEQGLAREDAIFRAIEEHGHPRTVGYGLRPHFPWIDVRTQSTARGVVAIGPKAVGVVAMGGTAIGILSFGGVSLGLFSMCGVELGLFLGLGGCVLVPLGCAWGGLAVGFVAVGGMACGVIASGGMAIGMWVPGAGQAFRYFTFETAPQWMRFMDNQLSYSNEAERRLFFQATGYYTIGYLITLGFLLGVQMKMMRKEFNRIRRVDPTLVE